MNRSISSNSIGYTYSSKSSRRASLVHVPRRRCSCDANKLQVELDTLRETTKEALQLSWDEVEALQTKLSKRETLIRELKKELKRTQDELAKSKRKEFDSNARNAKLEHKLSKVRSSKSNSSFPNSIFSWQTNTSKSEPTLSIDTSKRNFLTTTTRRTTLPLSKDTTMNSTWHHPMRRRVSFCDSTEVTCHSIAATDGCSELSVDMNSINEEVPETYPSVHSYRSGHQQDLDSTIHSNIASLDLSGKSLSNQEYFVPLKDSSDDCDRPTMDEKDVTIRDLKLRLMGRDDAIASMEDTIVQNIKVMQQLQMTTLSPSNEEYCSL